jgi:PleD family two-component response regulator
VSPTVGVDGYKWGKPRRIIVGTSDPSWRSRIANVAKPHGVEVLFSTDEKNISRLAIETRPSIVVLELDSIEYDPFECCLALEWRSDVTVWGFYPDMREDLESKAYGVGMDGIIPGSRFLEQFGQNLRLRSEKQ